LYGVTHTRTTAAHGGQVVIASFVSLGAVNQRPKRSKIIKYCGTTTTQKQKRCADVNLKGIIGMKLPLNILDFVS
jgi:hypothetical protein